MADNFSCSRALRVLGQILETRRVDLFEIRSEGPYFTLQYGDPNPPHVALIDVKYSAAELRSLDLEARTKRQTVFRVVNFNGMAEILRALGHRVEAEGGQLVRVANYESPSADDDIVLEYQKANGRRYVEHVRAAALTDHAMRMYRGRSRVRREPFAG